MTSTSCNTDESRKAAVRFDTPLSDGFNVRGGLERNLKGGCGEAFCGGCFVVFF